MTDPRPRSTPRPRAARKASWLLVPVLLTSLVPATAQDDAAARFGDRVEVTEVLLDVVAFDREGEPVPDLGLDDFVVREGGEVRELTGVSFYTTWYDPAGDRLPDEEHAAEIPSSRYFILFFHDVRFQQAQPLAALPRMMQYQRRAGYDAERWLLEDLQPSDWVAVVGWGRRGLALYQDFTQDRTKLAEAAVMAGAGRPPALVAPSERPRPPRSGEPALRRRLDDIESLARSTKRIDDALALVADAAGHIVGRKNLILFTPGIGGPTAPRRDDGTVVAVDEALNAHNVAVYAVDLGCPSERGREAWIAEGSGGAFVTGLRFASSLRRISRENRGYYVLSYRTEVPIDGEGYRDVEVLTRDRDIEIRARQGFRYGT